MSGWRGMLPAPAVHESRCSDMALDRENLLAELCADRVPTSGFGCCWLIVSTLRRIGRLE
jgi:hypothetical protein